MDFHALGGRRAEGFTLVEALFSFVTLSLVLMVLFNLFPSSVLAVRRADQQVQADSLAQSVLEEHRARPFSGLVVGTQALDPVVADGVEYRPSVEVSTVPGTAADRLRVVRVTVAWTDRKKERQVRHEVWVAHVAR